MNAQFAGNGADLPMLGVKVAANLRAGFRTDHEMDHLRRGMRGNGSMKRPRRPQINARTGSVVQRCETGIAADDKRLPDRRMTLLADRPFHIRNNAGEVIEWEP